MPAKNSKNPASTLTLKRRRLDVTKTSRCHNDVQMMSFKRLVPTGKVSLDETSCVFHFHLMLTYLYSLIRMAVYNVCVVSAVGVICASALYNTQHYTTGYLVVTISIFLCTTGTLLLIFVPKVSLAGFPLYQG